MRMLDALCSSWIEQYTIEGMWQETSKIELLDDAHKNLILSGLSPAPETRSFYQKLFIKPTWN